MVTIQSLLGLCLILAAAALTCACTPNGASNAEKTPEVGVQLAAIKSVPIRATSRYVGTVKSRRSVALQPQVAGHITEIMVKSGDLVSAGAPLMQIDAEKQTESLNSSLAAQESNRAQRANAEATLKSLQADRLSKIANLKFAQDSYDRYSFLYGQGAVSKESVDQFFNRLQVSKAELEASETQITAQRAAIERDDFALKQSSASSNQEKVQLKYYTVKAPFAGTVGDVPVRLGEYVTATTNLTTVTQNRPLEVYVEIPAERAVSLKKGMVIELLDSAETVIGQGTVFFVSPQVNSTTQTILVKAIFDNNQDRLRSEEMVSARVVWNTTPQLLVPTSAVSHLSGQDFVFLAEQEGGNHLIARQKAVQLGEIHENSYLVVSGLKAGQRIVISGIQNLSDGLPIIPKS